MNGIPKQPIFGVQKASNGTVDDPRNPTTKLNRAAPGLDGKGSATTANVDQDADGEDIYPSSKLIDQFEDAFTDSQQERDDATKCRDYYDGFQLSDAEVRALERRGQPMVVSNRIAPKIDALIGLEKKMRTEPKAYPRTPREDDDANSVTDAIRFVCDENCWDDIRSAVAENLFIEGCGAVTVIVKPKDGKDKTEYDVKIVQVPWDRFYRDAHSRMRDFSDATYMGAVLWMDEDQAERLYPGREDKIESSYSQGISLGDTYDDRPKFQWGDRRRKRIRVLQHRFIKDGVWYMATLCRGGYLRDPQPSPYVDEDGVPQNDMIACSAYCDRDNRRYGITKRHISPQDEINKRRSKALHLLNSKQAIADKGAVDNIEQARREIARPDGFIEKNPNKQFEIVDGQPLAQGQMALLQEAKNEIDVSGVNPAISGDQQAPSGRAQEIQLSNGTNEMAKTFESLRLFAWQVYRQVWYRIRQYWTAETWIRVTDNEKNVRWVGLNKPVTMGDAIRQQQVQRMNAMRQKQGLPPLPMPGQFQPIFPQDMGQGQPQGQPQQSGQPGQPQPGQQPPIAGPGQLPNQGWDGAPLVDMNNPAMQQVVGYQNHLGSLDVDIILEDAPDAMTLQSEQFDALVSLAKVNPQWIPPQVIIEASNLRNKDEILAAMNNQGLPPAVQQQLAGLQKQLQDMQKINARLSQELQQDQTQQAKVVVDAQANQRKAENDLAARSNDQAELGLKQKQLEIQQYEAETARLVAIRPEPLPSVPAGWPVPNPNEHGGQDDHQPPGSAPSMASV